MNVSEWMWFKQDEWTYQSLPTKEFVFEVKGCSDVWINLVHTKGYTSPKYAIGLGTNKNAQCRIDKGGPVSSNFFKATYSGPTLNCNEYRKFWITWENHNIKVGRGRQPGTDVIMQWKDLGPVVDVNYVALASYKSPWTMIY